MRLIILFLTTFGCFTLADAVTTRIGLSRGGVELNPFTNAATLWTMLRVELFVGMAGVIAVIAGLALLKRSDAGRFIDDRQEFLAHYWSTRNLAGAILIFLPMGIAVGRILPVLSNLSLLLFGFSPWMMVVRWLSEVIGCSMFQANMMVSAAIFGALAYPMTDLIRWAVRPSLRKHETA